MTDVDPLTPPKQQTDVFLLCYSVASPSSFDNIKNKWFPEIKHHAPGVPFILVRGLFGTSRPMGASIAHEFTRGLTHSSTNQYHPLPQQQVGTKTDLRKDAEFARKTKLVTTEQGQLLASELGAYRHCECSALTQVRRGAVFRWWVLRVCDGSMDACPMCGVKWQYVPWLRMRLISRLPPRPPHTYTTTPRAGGPQARLRRGDPLRAGAPEQAAEEEEQVRRLLMPRGGPWAPVLLYIFSCHIARERERGAQR